MKPFITLICVGLLMSSCASIFCGSKAKVTFDGEISEEATLTIDGLKHTNVTFPYTTKIRRGFDAATGAITKPEFKFYQIDFQPKEAKTKASSVD